MKFDNPIPVSIDPCPINEAVVEIRFEPKVNSNAVFGIIYQQLMEKYPEVEELAVLQIPENLRAIQPELKYSPYYRIKDGNNIIQIGPRVISVVNNSPYIGWNEFSNLIFAVFNSVKTTNIFTDVLRFGLRYINKFDDGSLNKIKLKSKVDDEDFLIGSSVIRTQISRGNYLSNLLITNESEAIINNQKITTSIIDIDVYLENIENFFDSMKQIITDGHQVEKEIFFNLLTESYLATLNPIYND